MNSLRTRFLFLLVLVVTNARNECETFQECLSLAALHTASSPSYSAHLYDRATQLRLNSKEAWLGRGALAQDAGELEVAASHLSRALGLDPLCWRVGINIGNLAARQGNLTTALRAFSHVIRTNPFIPQAFYSRGFVQLLQGRLQQSCASFQRAWALKPDLHTIPEFLFALEGLQSLRSAMLDARASLSQPNVACPIQHVDNRAREPANGARAARPPDAEILSVWEDGYMRGQGCEECAEGAIEVVTLFAPEGGHSDVGGADSRSSMDAMRDLVGSLHALYGPDCTGVVALHILVPARTLPAEKLAEIAAWHLVQVHTIPPTSPPTPRVLESKPEGTVTEEGGQGDEVGLEWGGQGFLKLLYEMHSAALLPRQFVAVHSRVLLSSSAGRQALQALIEAARSSADGMAWAGEALPDEDRDGEAECRDWAVGVELHRFHRFVSAEMTAPSNCPIVVGRGLSAPRAYADLVVLEWTVSPTDRRSRGAEHAARVTAILGHNRISASSPQSTRRERGSAWLQRLERAVAEARVVVVVVPPAHEHAHAHSITPAAGETSAEIQPDVSPEDNQDARGEDALICDVLTRMHSRFGGRGNGPSAVFGLALDGAPVHGCERGGGSGGVQWFEKRGNWRTDCSEFLQKTPLQTSVAMDQDLEAGHNLTPLVDAIGLLLWPAGDRTKAPAPKCHIRTRDIQRPPTPDSPLLLPPHLLGRQRICLCVPTLSPPGVDQVHRLPLLDILVRSLVRSVTSSANADAGGRAGNLDGEGVDAAYTFVVYVAYDEGDHMYDKRGEQVWSSLKNITSNSPVYVHPFKLPPTKGGIAYLWNSLMLAAFQDGCEYMYQSNDDVEFVTAGWASKFVSTLRASRIRPNFGVVGGLDENNHLVLTQSFVHRTHQEIFGMHFPRTIKNWHLDDWISTIYGDEATFHLKDVLIRNTNAFGTRYAECREDEKWFRNEVERARILIRHWWGVIRR